MATHSASQTDNTPFTAVNYFQDTAWTPTITGLGTPTGVVARYWVVGEYMTGKVTGTTGTPTGTLASVSLPNGWTSSEGQVHGVNFKVGDWQRFTAVAANVKNGIINAASSGPVNALNFGFSDNTNPASPVTAQNGSAMYAASEGFEWNFRVRIDQLLGGYNAPGAGISATNPSLVPGGVDSGSVSENWAGPMASIAGNLTYARQGKLVTLSFPRTKNTGNNTASQITASASLPSSLRPASNQFFPIFVADNAVDQSTPGYISISSAGAIVISKSLGTANFSANTGSTGFYETTVSYLTA